MNLNSYLKPIIDELSKLNSKPLLVRRNGQEIAKSRVTAMFISGDGVQCNELMNFGGHCCTYGCRFCLTKGQHRGDVRNKQGVVTEGAHGMYFENRNQQMRSRDSLLLKDKSAMYVSTPIFFPFNYYLPKFFTQNS